MLQTQVIEFDIHHHTYRSLKLDELDLSTSDDHLIYWAHCDLNQPELFQQLIKTLHLPDDIVTICKTQNPIPKLIEDNESLLIQTECLLQTELIPGNDIAFGNIIIFLTHRYCFTASAHTIPALIEFNENVHKYTKYAKTPCFILYLVLDNIINDYSKILLGFEILADQIDIQIKETQENIYNDVMLIKKQIMKAQHHIAAIRDILMRISGRMIAVVSKPCRSSLANLLEHTHIIFNETEVIREILKNTLSQIDNALMQRLNNTMKVLTAFAAIFLPLSLIAAIYGMNFRWMPELEWRYGYLWALSLMFICGLTLVIIFKKKKWW